MFWELPKVENTLNDLWQSCFFNDCGALIKSTDDLSRTTPTPAPDPLTKPTTAIVGSCEEKEQCIKLGFVD